MMETIRINWLLLAAPLLWSLGIALFLALIGLMEFSKTTRNVNRKEFLKSTFCKTTAGVGIALVVGGLLLNFAQIPSHRFIAVKLEKPTSSSLITVSPGTPLAFSPNELKMDPKNRGHYLNNQGMKNNTMALFWDGFIRTPFLQFDKGNYRVQFQARGTEAENEYARIKIEFEIPGEKNYLVTKKIAYFELTDKMHMYEMDFQTETSVIGRIRITYFNDIYIPETKKGRDVWLKDIILNSNQYRKDNNEP